MLRFDGFDTQLEDQDAFIQPTPATEIALGELVVQPDYGVVTDNEFGRIEIGEEHMDDLGGFGLAARDGRSEIGDDSVEAAYAKQVARQENIGEDYAGYDDLGGFGLAARDGRSEIGGYAPAEGRSEIGGYAPAEGRSEIGVDQDYEVGAAHRKQAAAQARIGRGYSGYAPAEGRSEIGFEDLLARSKGTIVGGYAPAEGRSEIGFDYLGGFGLAARDGRSEIGYDAFNTEVFGEDAEVGAAHRRQVAAQARMGTDFADLGGDAFDNDFLSEIDFKAGYAPAEGRSELMGALVSVVKKARDSRVPPPPLKAVDVDSPFPDTSWGDTLDLYIGEVIAATGNPQVFARTAEFMQRAGQGMEPRVVRIDTEENYNRMRQERSPELSELKQQLAELKARVEAHAVDPHAHELDQDALSEDIQDLVLLGAMAQQKEMDKRLDFWMPKHFDGFATTWRESDHMGAAIALPSPDGTARIATSLEEVGKCVGEMVEYATEVGLDLAENPQLTSHIVALGCVMGAGTPMKEVAAAAKSIAKRPEMKTGQSFVVRLEPKVNPALTALFMLVMACRAGDKKSQEELAALGAASPAPVKQALAEAVKLAKAAAV